MAQNPRPPEPPRPPGPHDPDPPEPPRPPGPYDDGDEEPAEDSYRIGLERFDAQPDKGDESLCFHRLSCLYSDREVDCLLVVYDDGSG